MKRKQNSTMRFVEQHKLLRNLTMLLIMLVQFTVTSCGGDKKNDSSNDMEGMENMKSTPSQPAQKQDGMEGMDMGEKKMNMSESNKDSLDISSIVLPANYLVVSAQKTVKPVLSTALNGIKSLGYIAVDERRNNKVSTRFSGRIEKLYVKYKMQYVKQGEKIMDLYSAELNTYQEELLFLMKGNSEEKLMEKAEEKLRLLGITQAQINEIKRTGNTFYTLSIYSPQDGYVFFKPSESTNPNAMNSIAATSETKGMNTMGQKTESEGNMNTSAGQIREGNYVNKGQTLFWINDLKEVWAIIGIDNSHQQELKTGTKLSLVSELYKTDTIHTTINFIEPIYRQNQKFILSRTYLKNSDYKYKINSLVEAIINTDNKPTLQIPYSSVLFLGKRKVVWVKKKETQGGNHIFEVRDIAIGVIHGNRIEVVSGLTLDDEIALEAGYLLDRESLIKPE